MGFDVTDDRIPWIHHTRSLHPALTQHDVHLRILIGALKIPINTNNTQKSIPIRRRPSIVTIYGKTLSM